MFPLFLLLFLTATISVNAMDGRNYYNSVGEYALAVDQGVHSMIVAFMQGKPHMVRVTHDASEITYRAKLKGNERIRFMVSRLNGNKSDDTIRVEYEEQNKGLRLFENEKNSIAKVFLHEDIKGMTFDKYDALYKKNQSNNGQQ